MKSGEVISTKFLIVTDKGKVNPSAKTHIYWVESRKDQSFLGHIKWKGNWRKYCFDSQVATYDDQCLDDISGICRSLTTAYKERKK